MPQVIVTSPAGEKQIVNAPLGQSLMMSLRDHGNGTVDENFGHCNGCCTCYTCHVWVDQEFLPGLPAMSAQEDDLLSLATERRPNSRLACQIPLTDALDGLRLTLPPLD